MSNILVVPVFEKENRKGTQIKKTYLQVWLHLYG